VFARLAGLTPGVARWGSYAEQAPATRRAGATQRPRRPGVGSASSAAGCTRGTRFERIHRPAWSGGWTRTPTQSTRCVSHRELLFGAGAAGSSDAAQPEFPPDGRPEVPLAKARPGLHVLWRPPRPRRPVRAPAGEALSLGPHWPPSRMDADAVAVVLSSAAWRVTLTGHDAIRGATIALETSR